jgi:hypothetical protein
MGLQSSSQETFQFLLGILSSEKITTIWIVMLYNSTSQASQKVLGLEKNSYISLNLPLKVKTRAKHGGILL